MLDIFERIAARLGQVWLSFFEKMTLPLKVTSNDPICGYTTYLLVFASTYLFYAILNGMRCVGIILPMTSSSGIRLATISLTV